MLQLIAFVELKSQVKPVRKRSALDVANLLQNCYNLSTIASVLVDYTRRARVAPKRLFVFGTLDLNS
jgi:hypothetical protein